MTVLFDTLNSTYQLVDCRPGACEITFGSQVQVLKAMGRHFRVIGDATVIYPPEVGGSCCLQFDDWHMTTSVIQRVH
jgi:hypothetical protein